MPEQPNPLRVAWSIVRALRTRRPDPNGTDVVEHDRLAPVLETLRTQGVPALPDLAEEIALYRKDLEEVDPDALSRDEALAYWLNLYNAGALDLAGTAVASGESTVLRVPAGFSRPWANVAGETLSLDDIEHGKIRRFKDARIHGALVCGSASCPTLRYEPYRGDSIDEQLETQMQGFLADGGAVADRSGSQLLLSRVLLWFGGDVVRPWRMPTFLPASRKAVVRAIAPWLDTELRDWIYRSHPTIGYQPYDWSLGCTIR